MTWSLEEAIAYYKSLGAPQDQSTLVSLLKEVQEHSGGAVPKHMLEQMADACGIPVSFLLAIIKRIPSLRMADSHLLEVCAGSNCGKCRDLAAFAEGLRNQKITVRFVPCMRLCGKGPNIKWDGVLYHRADESLLRKLTKQ